MYKVTVQNEVIELTLKQGQILLNDNVLDVVKIDTGIYHTIIDGHSENVQIKKIDKAAKLVYASINGKAVTIKIADKMDALLQNMGLESAMVKKINNLKAPMPGLVIEILAKKGDVVIKGEPLLVLEAMKMENVIKSEGDGIIKEILVIAKDAVDKNQVLLTFE